MTPVAAAIVVGVVVVAPPFDRLADSSFAWHMVQHLVLFYLVALLLLAARPFDLYARLAGKRATAALVRMTRPLHVIALPQVALVVFIATLWGTHFSALYELALEHPAIHFAEHFLYLAAGVVFWLPVMAPPPLRPLSYPARLLYLAVALPQGALLGMVLASARQPLYAHYASVEGSRALADQANAAAVMWIAGGSVVFCALLLVLAAWAHRDGDYARSSSITQKPDASSSIAKPRSSSRPSKFSRRTHSPSRLVK
jgi:putative membrane protein